MLLYTIVPPEIIFNNNSYEDNEAYKDKTFKSVEIEYCGEKVQASLFSDNSMIVDRIISSDFKSYLNPALQPGMSVDNSMVTNKK